MPGEAGMRAGREDSKGKEVALKSVGPGSCLCQGYASFLFLSNHLFLSWKNCLFPSKNRTEMGEESLEVSALLYCGKGRIIWVGRECGRVENLGG